MLRGSFCRTASLLRLLASTAAAEVSSVIWVSEPVLPGQVALLNVAGSNMTTDSQVEVRQPPGGPGSWTAVTPEGVTEHGCGIEVPGDFQASAFEIRINGGEPYTANQPRPWFMFGDMGDAATAGGWIRVMGEAITLRKDGVELPLLRLTPLAADSEPLVLHATPTGSRPGSGLTRWHAHFQLPKGISLGKYTAAVAHADGNFVELCTFIDESTPCLSKIGVNPAGVALADPRKKWPQSSIFRVNATQPGPGRDATAAVQEAIAAATSNGGGVVFFPRGQYFVKGPIIVAPGTVIRGEARHLVSIYFAEDAQATAPDAYVTSASAGAWGLSDVTLYVTAYCNNIVRFLPGTDGAFMRRTTIRFNSYFCLEPKKGSGSRGRNSNWEHDIGTAVLLAGRNLFVTDNDIYSSGDVVSSRNNGAAGAEYMHIARNRFWNGGTTHWGISWKQCIYEDNDATGVSTTAMGSNYPQYSHNDGAPHVQNIYHHNNSQTQVWGNDREMMTCDGGGGVYYGSATAAAGSDTVVLAKNASGPQLGGALCVIQGSGTGQCRRVLSTSAGDLSHFVVDRPLTAAIDETSRVTIVPFIGQIAFNGNKYSDGGEVQFYAQAFGCVAAENRFERTGGLSTWARGYSGVDANLHVSFLDNDVVEGNHVWNYATKPTPIEDPSKYPYFPGGSKTIEPWFFGSLTNEQGPPIDPSDSAQGFKGAFNRFVVFRGNQVRSNGGIVVRGTTANVVIEGSTIMDSHVGIHVNYTTTQGGIILRDNKEPAGVPDNFNPYACSEASDKQSTLV